MNWEIIGTVSAIMTVVLFVMYFIGRIWVIIHSKKQNDEKFSAVDKNYEIADEFFVGSINTETIFLTAHNQLLSIKIYECAWDSQKHKISKGDLVENCGGLDRGLTLKFNTYLSEGIPQFLLEYISYDYTKGTLCFVENGRNRIIKEMIYKKHTVKSVLYYLFK